MYITKDGSNVLNVTRAIYNELYKDKGWIPTSEQAKGRKQNSTIFMNPQPIVEDDSTWNEMPYYEQEPIDEIPDLDNMNYQSLLALAKQHNIRLGSVRQKDEIIELLRRELNV